MECPAIGQQAVGQFQYDQKDGIVCNQNVKITVHKPNIKFIFAVMAIAKKQLSIAQHISMICFALFALSPCTVKGFFFSAEHIALQQPLNKSRTTAPSHTCQYFQSSRSQLVVTKKSKQFIEPAAALLIDKEPVFQQRSGRRCFNNFSGNSPPRYILFKRLKLGVA